MTASAAEKLSVAIQLRKAGSSRASVGDRNVVPKVAEEGGSAGAPFIQRRHPAEGAFRRTPRG